jgi:hypothetical protein
VEISEILSIIKVFDREMGLRFAICHYGSLYIFIFNIFFFVIPEVTSGHFPVPFLYGHFWDHVSHACLLVLIGGAVPYFGRQW